MGKVKIIDAFKTKYIIPCFQREYSWETKEIEELIEDISESKNEYCIGIITITLSGEKKKLIDGQQRLTTMYMIAIACGYFNANDKINLFYETDEILSSENKLKLLLKSDKSSSLYDKFDNVVDIVEKIGKDKVKEKMNYVYFYEININKNGTDLNHYFEVMNSRGIQLCRSDIIKSFLMNILTDKKDEKRLNNLWNSYETMMPKRYSSFELISTKTEYEEKTIIGILSSKTNKQQKDKSVDEIDDSSILDFDYFLLYVIRLYRKIIKNITDDYEMFELKDMVNEYKETFKGSSVDEVRGFLNFLIEMKNIYDAKIIKNSREKQDADSNWILGITTNKKDIIMIQSCLRVSFTNRKQMKWLFETLKYFYEKRSINQYVNYMRDFIRVNYLNEFLSNAKSLNYQTGFDTPRIVLNYLDYLIYENREEFGKKVNFVNCLNLKKFNFKFRNSLEHFLPRENDDKFKNSDWVNDFGNLALLAYGTNTKMQNATPTNKADYFKDNLPEYSIKLQLMTKLALEDGDWTREKCIDLRKKLFELLEDDIKKANF